MYKRNSRDLSREICVIFVLGPWDLWSISLKETPQRCLSWTSVLSDELSDISTMKIAIALNPSAAHKVNSGNTESLVDFFVADSRSSSFEIAHLYCAKGKSHTGKPPA